MQWLGIVLWHDLNTKSDESAVRPRSLVRVAHNHTQRMLAIAGRVPSSIALQPRCSPLYREETRDKRNAFSTIITVLITITIIYLVQFSVQLMEVFTF